jgi:hypothetical protein
MDLVLKSVQHLNGRLNNVGIFKHIDDNREQLVAGIRKLLNFTNCHNELFTDSINTLTADIELKSTLLKGMRANLPNILNDLIYSRNIPRILANITRINTPNIPVTSNDIQLICDGLRELVSAESSFFNEIHENIHERSGILDIQRRLQQLETDYARCLTDQQAATAVLAAANAYLQQLKTTCATLQVLLPSAGAPVPTSIADANRQISGCLGALIGFLNDATFLSPMVAQTLMGLATDFIRNEVRGKLDHTLADTKLDQCENKSITEQIKREMGNLLTNETDKVDRLADPKSAHVVTAPFKSRIQKILDGLGAEQDSIPALKLATDYARPKPSTDFIQQIGDIQARVPEALRDYFKNESRGLSDEIDKFVSVSLARIDRCIQDASTAAATAAQKQKLEQQLERYLDALQRVQQVSGVLPPPALGPPSTTATTDVRIKSGLESLRVHFNSGISDKIKEVNGNKLAIDALIVSITSKRDKLRRFIDTGLDICGDDVPKVAKIKTSLEAIRQLNATMITLHTNLLKIARTLPRLEIIRDAILTKIQTEITNCSSQVSLAALNPATITGIGEEMNALKRNYDDLNQKSAGILTEANTISTNNDEATATAKKEIDDCITARKAVADGLLDRASKAIATMKPNATVCKDRIDELCQMAENGAITTVADTNPAKPGLIARLDALKQSCSEFTRQLTEMVPSLYAVPSTTNSIDNVLADIVAYQRGLNNPAIGAAQLHQLYTTALANVGELATNNAKIARMLDELKNKKDEIDAIKVDIGGVIAAQEEAAEAEKAANGNVFDELIHTNFSGVSFDPRRGELILSFGNAQQPLNVGTQRHALGKGGEISPRPPSRHLPGQADSEDEADDKSSPEPGPAGVGRARAAAVAEPYSVVITPTSRFYKKLVLGKDPQRIWLTEIPLADLKAEFAAKKVSLIEGADASSKVVPTDKLAIAKAAAQNPVVVMTLLASLKPKTPISLVQYDKLVRLCDKGSAAGVINELLFVKDKVGVPITAGLGAVIRKNQDGNMIIDSINPGGGAAATKNVEKGDTILQVNGLPVKGMTEDAVKHLIAGIPGSECVLTLLRLGNDKAFKVSVRRIPITAGIGVIINKQSNGQMKIDGINGSGGAAATRQFKVGDIISEVDGRTVTGLEIEQVKDMLAGASGSQCDLTLTRTGVVLPFIVRVRRIPPLPPNNISDILQKLGWVRNTNTVWYNDTVIRNTGTGQVLQGGFFSLFSFKDRKISQFLHTNCETDYVCMLNWIFLIALRLNNSEPLRFTSDDIQELLKNTYNSVYSFVESEQPFQSFFMTVSSSPSDMYTSRVNTNLDGKIFKDNTLTPIVTRIKGELYHLDESVPLHSSQPGSASSSRSASPSKVPGGSVASSSFQLVEPELKVGGGHKKKTRRINRKIDSHHTIKKHSKRDSKRGEKGTRRRHNKLRAKGHLSRIKTIRSDPVYFSV